MHFALYAGNNFPVTFYLIYSKGTPMSTADLIIIIYSVIYMTVSAQCLWAAQNLFMLGLRAFR